MKKLAFAVAALFVAVSLAANLQARPQYNKQFETVVKENEALSKALGGKSNCNLCHQGTASKKNRNDFGKAVQEAIEKKNVMDVKVITKAIEEASEAKLPEDDSKTFGDLIKSGELPLTKDEPKKE